MPPTNAEVVERAVDAVNETYRTGDTEPLRRYAAAQCAPDMVLEAPTDAFTEGQWHGPEGAVAFVANQMEVLEPDGGPGGHVAPGRRAHRRRRR